ncbi:hypothetical protein Q7P37_004222 [Cladosporium fusiforme]
MGNNKKGGRKKPDKGQGKKPGGQGYMIGQNLVDESSQSSRPTGPAQQQTSSSTTRTPASTTQNAITEHVATSPSPTAPGSSLPATNLFGFDSSDSASYPVTSPYVAGPVQDATPHPSTTVSPLAQQPASVASTPNPAPPPSSVDTTDLPIQDLSINDAGSNVQSEISHRSAPDQDTKGEAQRCCEGKDSHRNRKVFIQMPPRKSAGGMKSTKTELHDQTGFWHDAKKAEVQEFRQDHGEVVPPIHLLRPAPIVKTDPKLTVITNHFKVTVPKGLRLYEYTIGNIPDTSTRAKRKVMILDMIEVDQGLYNIRDRIATDYKSKIITNKPLFGRVVAPGTEVHSVTINNFTAGIRTTPDTIRLKISLNAEYNLDGLNGYVAGDNEFYQERGAKEALNIIIAKAVTDPENNEDTFQVGNNRFYFRPGWTPIDNHNSTDGIGLVSTRGYFSSIKPAMGSILLNVSNVTSAFYKAQSLQEYFTEFWDAEPVNGWSPEKRNAMREHLCGLRVRVNFSRAGPPNQGPEIDMNARRVKTLCGLGACPTRQKVTRDDGKPEITVWEHLENTYGPHGVKLDDAYNSFPTANVGRKERGNEKFYLASQLDVISDQLYKGTCPEVTAQMITSAKRDPAENYSAILEEGMKCLRLDQGTSPAMLGDLQIIVSPHLLQLPAREINPPTISYSGPGLSIPTEHGAWRMMRDSKFKKKGGPKLKIQFFRGDSATYDDSFFEFYMKSFLEHPKKWGVQTMVLRNPKSKWELINDWNPEALRSKFEQLSKSIPFDVAVVVFPSTDYKQRQHYTFFKIAADQLCGLKTVCMCETKIVPKNRASVISGQNFPLGRSIDYFRNISMKLNIRLGNFNHLIDSGPLNKMRRIAPNTIILGADVTHPSAGSLDHTPSIAAVVGTVDSDFARFGGSMRLNEPRKEIISAMETMTKERLREWAAQNSNMLPQHILFYRDGVSDSQYSDVRRHEVSAIRSAWNELKTSEKLKSPKTQVKITAIVVTKRHHTRLYPDPDLEEKDDHKTTSTNCLPGTIVDHTVTWPYYFDFYLLSHDVPTNTRGPSGTAKPSHYIVLENEMEFEAKLVQDVTFHLCFMYARSNTSVSYVPAAYYADRLCERGRLYLKPFLDRCVRDRQNYANMDADRFIREYEQVFYRGGGRGAIGTSANPWHKDLDGTMFWM